MLEVVICSTILLTSAMGAARAQLDASRLLTEAQQTNVAIGVVQAALDAALEVDLDGLLAGDGAIALDGEIALDNALLADQRVVLDAPGYDPVADPAPDSLELRVTLTWTSLTGQPRQLVLSGVTR